MTIKEFLKQNNEISNMALMAISLFWCFLGIMSDSWVIILSIPMGFMVAFIGDKYFRD